MLNKIISNLHIYQKDIATKGIYWTVVLRLYKIPGVKKRLEPVINSRKPEAVKVAGFKCFIDKQDTEISQKLVEEGVWEAYETEIFKQKIKPGDVVLDIGAHIGYYTLIAAAQAGPTGRVYAFEPEPHNFALLVKNIRENKIKNVTAMNKAVAEKAGKAILYVDSKNTGDNRLYGSDDKKPIEVETITLDEYFNKKKEKADFIIMDIQGSETKALAGAMNLIKRSGGLTMMLEYWPEGLRLNNSSGNELIKMIYDLGYKIEIINGAKRQIDQVSKKVLKKITLANLLVSRRIKK